MSWLVRKRFGGAALFIALIAAPGARAQHLTAEPVLEAVPAGSSLLLTAQPSKMREPLSDGGAGFDKVSDISFPEDGSPRDPRDLVGNMSIAGSLDLGIGLFPVAGTGSRSNEIKRNWSVREVTPKRENIAAVGMRFQF